MVELAHHVQSTDQHVRPCRAGSQHRRPAWLPVRGSPVLAAAARNASVSRASVAGLGCTGQAAGAAQHRSRQRAGRAPGSKPIKRQQRPRAEHTHPALRSAVGVRRWTDTPAQRHEHSAPPPNPTRADSACSCGVPSTLRPPSRGSKGSGLPRRGPSKGTVGGWAGRLGCTLQRASGLLDRGQPVRRALTLHLHAQSLTRPGHAPCPDTASASKQDASTCCADLSVCGWLDM